MPSGTLYVVATPIGNLEDCSRRAIAVFREADLVAAEDTRRSIKLLNHYGIERPLESYHEFNEAEKAQQLANRLEEGATIALVTDAGTPTISDPGYRLVRLCRERRIPVIPVPGPSAVVAALSVSGLPTDEFFFAGFLPARSGARRKKLESMKNLSCTLAFYEGPHRVRAALADIGDVFGDRRIFIGREMTKIHEEYLAGRISEVAPGVTERGEFVVLVEGATDAGHIASPSIDLTHLSRQDVIKAAARCLGVGKKELYELLYRKETKE